MAKGPGSFHQPQQAAQRSALVAARLQQAIALHEQGQLDEAEPVYREILAQAPAHFDALHLLGVLQHQRGMHESAVELIGRAIALNSSQPAAYSNIGLALHQLKRPQEALASYDRALALKPDYAEAHNNRGNALRELKRPQEALAAYDRALALKPGFAEAHMNRGNALQDLRRLEEALATYDRALALKPGYAEAHNNRGDVLQKLKRPGEALASCDQALALKPDYPEALNNRGNALQDLNLTEEALASYDRALALKPDYPEALMNRGNALQDLNRPGEALASFGRATSLRPDYAAAHWNESLCRLLTGDFEQGWRSYEWRWQDEGLGEAKRDFEAPLWLGGQSIAGRTILLHAEQGYGDTLQFCRYATLVAKRGATVVLEVQPALKSLLAGLEGVERVLARGEPLPAFDCHCPLLSLPLALGTTLATVPARVPYLRSDPARVAAWAARLGEKSLPRIGVVWSGNPGQQNDHNRSMPLATFAPLLSGRAQFVSLQRELRPEDQPLLDARKDILHFGEEIRDFADAAALVDLMDVVITVDTATSHLAGALGKPEWILLPFAPGWRWLLDREDTPWYPTARLLRQPVIGDWASVVARARDKAVRPVLSGEAGSASPLRAVAGWMKRLTGAK